MLERLDPYAEEAIKLANQIAHQDGQEFVGTEHVLLAIARTGNGLGAQVLKRHGLSYNRLKTQIDAIVHKSMEETWVLGRLPGTPHLKNVVAHAIDEARQLNARQIGTEHLLLGLLRERGCVGQTALYQLGLRLSDVRRDIAELLASQPGQ